MISFNPCKFCKACIFIYYTQKVELRKGNIRTVWNLCLSDSKYLALSIMTLSTSGHFVEKGI